MKADENLRGKKRYLQVPPELLGKVMSGAEFLLRTAGIFRGYYAAVCFRFMKRSVLTDATLRFYSGMIHEDECFTPLALAIARRVEIIGDRLYWYRLRDGSIMTNEGDSGRERHLAHTMMAALRIRTGAEKMRLSGLQRKASDCAWRRLKDKCVRRAIRNFPAFRRACRVADELASPQERPALASLRRTILMGWIMGRFRRAASGRFARLFPYRGGKGADKR